MSRSDIYREAFRLEYRVKELERDLAAARAEAEKYKTLATEQGCYAAWDEATEDAKIFVAERDAARAEAERKDAILRQLAKDGRLWVDAKDIQAARVRLVYQPEHESEIAKARAEAARLREQVKRITKAANDVVRNADELDEYPWMIPELRAALEER